MPISVQTPPGSANNELIPVTGDTNWGPYTTSWMLAANNNLGFPKTGGLYYLTGDVNFGNTNGFILKYLISEAAATPSTSGVLRLGSADSIGWRNNANSANLLLGINGSDQLTFNGVPIASSATNGMLAQISPGVVVGRTITGTSLQIDLVNGDGIAGNPVVSIDPGYVGQTSITTLGTITTGTWNATTVAIAHGGTSATTANAAFNNLAPTQTSNANKYLQTDGTNTSWQQAVRSVSLNDTSTSPIYTTSPTSAANGIVAETITLNTQNANLMFAGPSSGGAAQPTFRSIVGADFATLFGPGNVYRSVGADALGNLSLTGLEESARGITMYPGTISSTTCGLIYVGGTGGPGTNPSIITNARATRSIWLTAKENVTSVAGDVAGVVVISGGDVTEGNLFTGGSITLKAGGPRTLGGFGPPTNVTGGNVYIAGGDASGTGTTGSIFFNTNILEIKPTGGFAFAGTSNFGSSGQVLTSGGNTTPSWASIPANVSSFNTRTGAVTLTSGDVTTSLGYTPAHTIDFQRVYPAIVAGTTTLTVTVQETMLVLDANGSVLASYTVNLPGSSTPNGTIVHIKAFAGVTSLTIGAGSGNTLSGTSPTSLTNGNTLTFVYYSATNTWYF